jgi:hypothetical protein
MLWERSLIAIADRSHSIGIAIADRSHSIRIAIADRSHAPPWERLAAANDGPCQEHGPLPKLVQCS